MDENVDHAEEADVLMKVVIVGDSGVGKTNLLTRFCKNVFDLNTKNTIGVDFQSYDLKMNDKRVRVQFWDTAGQEKYQAISSTYYNNSQGAIIVYDITKQESFQNVPNWLAKLRESASPFIPVIVLGNKLDLENQREVKEETARKFAKSKELLFAEVSAMTNVDDCVIHAFHFLIKEIMTMIEKEEDGSISNSKIKYRKRTEYLKSRGADKDVNDQCC